MRKRKATQHAAIRERAANAIRDLYHNATPRYPSLEDEPSRVFESWFQDAAQFEIEYLQDGGAYGSNYRDTLAASCNAGKYKSERARKYYIRKGMADMRLDRATQAWERIGEYGKLYTYGRGGRTLAPEGLVNSRGRSFGMKEDYCEERPIADCVDLIRIVESFNDYVASWCKSVPEQWQEFWEKYIDEVDTETEPTE